MTAICVVPARGGSKGIPNKNLQLVNNQTLLQRVVEKAKCSFAQNKIYVSSDDKNILSEARNLGVSSSSALTRIAATLLPTQLILRLRRLMNQ